MLVSHFMITYSFMFGKLKGSSTLLRAHGKGGASATILSVPPSEKSAGGFQQAGKKEGGWGEGIFARLLTAPKARLGWERLSSVQSRFALRSVIATKLDIESFRKKARARGVYPTPSLLWCEARALGGFYSDFPPQSAIRPTNPNRLFWRAGGGSELQSNSQMKFVSNFSCAASRHYEASFLIPRFTAKGD